MGKDLDAAAAMQQIQRAGSIAMTPELFEKIYLTPQTNVKGDLRKYFGNPTPLCVLFSPPGRDWVRSYADPVI